jgi:hypothetical protein
MNSTIRTAALTALALIGALLVRPLAAQTTLADPNDAIYADIDVWATKGVLKNLPRLRPYTEAMTIGLLNEVLSKGTDADAVEAQRYLDILKDGKVHPRADVRADAAISSKGSNTNYVVAGAPGLSVNSLFGDRFGISARMDVWLTKGQTSDVTPYGTNYDRDFLYGSGSGLGGGVEATQDLVSDASYGDENLGVQAGFMRGSWGPIYDDGVIIGPQSPETGQFTFSWRTPELTADVGFFMLQQGWADTGFSSGKYLMIHGVNWAPVSWLELGINESMVWTNRIEPLYFIPLSEYFMSQSFSGYGDNSFAGLTASVYLPQNLKLDLVGYADDINFAGILKGEWDTKWKLAAQARLSWAPETPVLQLLTLDYTAVGPYTYTHWADGYMTDSNGTPIPYNGALAYTNKGENIGPALDPNSDRVVLKARSRSYQGLQVTGIATLIRHGDASQINAPPYHPANGDTSGDLEDSGVDATNGWIFQGPYNTGTWPEYFRFLTQSILQITSQAGFDLSYSRPIAGLGIMQLDFGYLFEYIANNQCIAGNTSVRQYLSLSAGLQF